MRRPASGTVAEVQNITSQQTYQAYQEMLAHDKIDIVVVGDVDEAAVYQAMRALDFSPRQSPCTKASCTTKRPAKHQPLQLRFSHWPRLSWTWPTTCPLTTGRTTT